MFSERKTNGFLDRGSINTLVDISTKEWLDIKEA
jgi:hypothetical protein